MDTNEQAPEIELAPPVIEPPIVEAIEIAEFSATGVETGARRMISAFDGIPPGWTIAPTIEVGEGKVRRHTGGGLWFETDPDPAPVVVAPRVRLPKLTLIDRLDKAGLLDKAIVVLGTGKQRIRWDASREVDPSNADVRMLLTVIAGAEHVDELLAPETAAEKAI